MSPALLSPCRSLLQTPGLPFPKPPNSGEREIGSDPELGFLATRAWGKWLLSSEPQFPLLSNVGKGQPSLNEMMQLKGLAWCPAPWKRSVNTGLVTVHLLQVSLG